MAVNNLLQKMKSHTNHSNMEKARFLKVGQGEWCVALCKLYSGRHNDANQVDIVYDDPQVCEQWDPFLVISLLLESRHSRQNPWIKEVAMYVPAEYYFSYNQRIVGPRIVRNMFLPNSNFKSSALLCLGCQEG